MPERSRAAGTSPSSQASTSVRVRALPARPGAAGPGSGWETRWVDPAPAQPPARARVIATKRAARMRRRRGEPAGGRALRAGRRSIGLWSRAVMVSSLPKPPAGHIARRSGLGLRPLAIRPGNVGAMGCWGTEADRGRDLGLPWGVGVGRTRRAGRGMRDRLAPRADPAQGGKPSRLRRRVPPRSGRIVATRACRGCAPQSPTRSARGRHQLPPYCGDVEERCVERDAFAGGGDGDIDVGPGVQEDIAAARDRSRCAAGARG